MSIIKLDSNGEYRIDAIKVINGKRIHINKKGFKSEEEARKALPLLVEKRISDITQIKKNAKFGSFFKMYLNHRSHKVSKSTLLAIKGIYNVSFKEYEDDNVSEILDIHNVLHLYKKIISRDEVSEKYKNRVIGELRLITDYALFLKLISNQTANDDKTILESIPITKKSKERECYNINQLNKFLNAIDDEDDKDLMVTYAYLGLRISEFIGLTWDCYDRLNRTIEIKQQILYLQQGKPVLVQRLKTKESYRKCRLNQEVYEILEKRRKKCSVGYIFPKNNKLNWEPLPKATLRKKMHKYMIKAKLPIISPHGFRHTKATLFMGVCKNMSEIKAAAKFMGHSVTMMMETYAHSEEKTIDTLIRRLEMI